MQTAIGSLSDRARHELPLTCLFGVFVFLQFTVLALANHAGEGYLAAEERTLVYYALQVFVILGYLVHCLYYRYCTGKRIRSAVAYGVFGLFFACVAVMLAAGPDSLAYVVVSMVAVLCLGGIGGAAHCRMSGETVTGTGVARCMGLGSAVAVVLQYLLQIAWGATPLLPVFMLAAIAVLLALFILLSKAPVADTVPCEEPEPIPSKRESSESMPSGLTQPESPQPGLSSSGLMQSGRMHPKSTSSKRIVISVLITATFIMFVCFYNEYIHHLMIQSDYESYTVYSLPRLMLVPGYLLFAVIGDMKNGKYVPLASLCIMLIALLNVILVGDQGAYWLNMCLFYFAIAAFTSYYLLTFWRLAPGTRHPALWAPFGRMLDSGMVLLAGAINLSALSAPMVLGVDIAGVALVILLMALGGDLNLIEAPREPEAPAPSPEERVKLLALECGLNERESEVLALLVFTEDKNQQIGAKLGISRRQVQTYISRIYEKTGASTRAGLVARVNGEEQLG